MLKKEKFFQVARFKNQQANAFYSPYTTRNEAFPLISTIPANGNVEVELRGVNIAHAMEWVNSCLLRLRE